MELIECLLDSEPIHIVRKWEPGATHVPATPISVFGDVNCFSDCVRILAGGHHHNGLRGRATLAVSRPFFGVRIFILASSINNDSVSWPIATVMAPIATVMAPEVHFLALTVFNRRLFQD